MGWRGFDAADEPRRPEANVRPPFIAPTAGPRNAALLRTFHQGAAEFHISDCNAHEAGLPPFLLFLSKAPPHKRGGRPANGFFVSCTYGFRGFTECKSRHLHAADGGKDIARRTAELSGRVLTQRSRIGAQISFLLRLLVKMYCSATRQECFVCADAFFFRALVA